MVVDGRIVVGTALLLAFIAGVLVGSPPSQRGPTPAASTIAAPASSETKAAFDAVYRNATWGTNGGDAGTSGYGSTMGSTVVYRAFLQKFLADANIHSVVDAGCGDWESTQAIDWSGIDYRGYDVVEDVIARDKERFERPNVHFFVADIVNTELPAADLIIVKQVLQHLPNASITKFLQQLPKYRHALLMNSVSARTLSADNRDIQVGDFRSLDLTAPPWSLPAERVLTYWDGSNMQQLLHVVHAAR